MILQFLAHQLRRLVYSSPRTSNQKREAEMENLMYRIALNEAKLTLMHRQWNHGACCPACMFGAAWSDVTDKLERQEKRLQLLIARRPTCSSG